MEEDASEELERFRRQWQQEVQARAKVKTVSTAHPHSTPARKQRTGQSRTPFPETSISDDRSKDAEELEAGRPYHDLHGQGGSQHKAIDDAASPPKHEPSSALEHYETAVQRESDGNLGDSLKHYRTAFKLDDAVDKLYKQKYFPTTRDASKPAEPTLPKASLSGPDTVQDSVKGLSVSKLIASFQSSQIVAVDAIGETSTSSCWISLLPTEILVDIIHLLTLSDPSALSVLSLVCRQFAFLSTAEDRIWHHVCDSESHGFRAMHHDWSLTIRGEPLPMSVEELDLRMAALSLPTKALPLSLSADYPNFRSMYHHRPRIRFNGCYISTVNYVRPGAATPSQATFASPVLIVTYYRYLRFFRDGSCISLLTTTEPSDVVHHLNRENMQTHHAGGLPAAVMNHALHGRWKLKGSPYGEAEPSAEEGMVDIETDGADADRPNPKYMYKMMLQMRHVNKATHATKNNKLVWLGYWSYNKLTDDWAEFSLKNDRAFFWSRVRSYDADE